MPRTKGAKNTMRVRRYRNGTSRALGVVPATLCRLIIDTFPKSPERRFIFALVSHVCGRGGEALCPTTLLKNLPGKIRNTTLRASLTERSLAFLDRNNYSFDLEERGDRDRNRACVYRIKPEVWASTAGEPRFRTLSDYRDGRQYGFHPVEFSEEAFAARIREFGTNVPYDEQLIQAIRRLSNRSFYFDQISAFADEELMADKEAKSNATRLPHGGFNTSYRLLLSGRISTYSATAAYSTNVQGIKKCVRRHFRAPEGYTHLMFDYKSQEPRLLAYISEDTDLQEALQGQFYEEIQETLGLEDRKTAKEVFNSIAYGREAWGLAQALFGRKNPLPEEVAQALQHLNAIKVKFPKAVAWCKDEAKRIKKEHKAVSKGGTVRTHFKLEDEEKTLGLNKTKTIGVNHVLQGTGADILRRLLVVLEQELEPFGAYVLLPMHDGLLVETPTDQTHDVAALVHRTMLAVPQELLPGIDLPVDMSFGFDQQ